MSKKITIIGATGHLGHRVTAKLVAQGAEVTAVVRDPARAKTILPASVRLVQGDVADPASLVTALADTETLYITLNTESLDVTLPFHSEREGVKNIVAAAQKTGVGHIMQIAGIDFIHPEFSTKGMAYGTNAIRKEGIAAIKVSDIPYTFFYCSVFMDSLPKFLEGGEMAVIGEHVNPIYFTNTTDLATLVFNAIDNPAARGKEFAVQGREAMTFAQGSEEFLRHFAPEAQVLNLPFETVRQMGLPEDQVIFFEHLLSFLEQTSEQQVSAETWRILGEPQTTIASFAQELRAEAQAA